VAIYLQTARLTLRTATPDDADLLVELNGDPEVMRYLNGGQPTSRAFITDEVIPFWLGIYERGAGLGYWLAERRADGEFLGWFHFRPGADADAGEGVELGYRLRRPAWGQGYATEGSLALISKGFTKLGVTRVFAHTMAVNAGSRRVLEKSGLTLTRTLPSDQVGVVEGAEQGDVEYALTRAEWLARAASVAG
jgi:RimJ/RimL family protein N-acetyltransferase